MFAQDDFVNFKGKAFPREVLFHKVKSLGWKDEQFKILTDEQVATVIDQKLTPAQVEIVHTVSDGKIDLDKIGEEPGIMNNDPPVDDDRKVKKAEAIAASGKHLTGVVHPLAQTERRIDLTQPPLPSIVREPRTKVDRILPIIDAAFHLSNSDATIPSARALLNANRLERVFQQMHPELAQKVLGRIDTSPDKDCLGGVVVDVEINEDYVHIVTTAGTITFAGRQINRK